MDVIEQNTRKILDILGNTTTRFIPVEILSKMSKDLGRILSTGARQKVYVTVNRITGELIDKSSEVNHLQRDNEYSQHCIECFNIDGMQHVRITNCSKDKPMSLDAQEILERSIKRVIKLSSVI